MQSIIDEMYYGNVQPTERSHKNNPRFIKADQLRQRNLDKLLAALGEPEKEIFEKYCEAQAELEDIARRDNFSYALKLGVMLMAEVYGGTDEIIGTRDIIY